MRKIDLIKIISDKTAIPQNDVYVTVERLLEEIRVTVARGEGVYFRGFGSFIQKKRAAKVGRNVKKNEALVIPERYVPVFKPAKRFLIKGTSETM